MKQFNNIPFYSLCFTFYLLHSTSSFAQTFSNTASQATGSWDGTLSKTISVSALSNPLSSPGNVLRQVNIDLGDGTNSRNLQTYVITLQSPAGSTITIKTTHTSMTVTGYNVKFRDHSILRFPQDHGSTKEPFNIGYYRTNTTGNFSAFNGEDPNGTWTITITETSVQTGMAYNKIDLVFGSSFIYNDITATTASDSCAGVECMETGTILIATNNGYENPGPATDPPLTLGGCGWNGAKNNSAWFNFKASAITAKFTISGVTNSLQILGFTLSGNCNAPVYSLVTGGCPNDVVNDTYTSPQYANGCNCNMQLNMSSLVQGNTYSIIVDGNGGAISDFYIEIKSGAESCSGCAMVSSITQKTDNICFGYSAGTATVSPSGGIQPYSFLWSNGQTDSTATGLTAGNYSVTITDNASCSSTASVTIAEPPEILNSESVAICSGDSIFIGGNYQTAQGIYYDTLQTVNSCDSIIETTLTVNSTYLNSESEAICSGDSIFLGGNYQTATGIYYDTLQTANNCDSIIETTLTVNSTYLNSESEAICSGDSIFIGGNYQTAQGIYYDTLQTVNSCDSIIETTLTVNSTFSISESVAICSGDSIFIGGNYQTATGIYYDTLQTANNCDSIIETTLTVNSTFSISESVAICSGDSIFIGGNYQTAQGIYYDTLQTVNSCDSIIETTLTVLQTTSSTLNNSACDSLTLNSQTYTASGAYTQTLVNAAGCDSTITLNLTILQNTGSTIDTTSCDNFNLNSQTYFTSGSFTQTIPNTDGCDSIITLNLTLNFSDTVNISGKICSGETYVFGSQILTNAGNYSALFFNVNECDSVVNLSLAVDSVFSIQKSDSICSNDSIFLQGNYQFTAGTYYDTLSSINNCDTIIETTLTVNQSPTSVNAFPDTTIYFDTQVQLNSTGNGTINWFPTDFLSCSDCPNPLANPDSTTIYYLTVFANGCSVSDSVLVIVEYPPSEIFVPNIFSPNGDLQNDFLFVYGRYIERIEWHIYNRWGEKVWECEGVKEQCKWDGTYNGKPLNNAVFVYYLNVYLSDKTEFFKQGNITIVR